MTRTSAAGRCRACRPRAGARRRRRRARTARPAAPRPPTWTCGRSRSIRRSRRPSAGESNASATVVRSSPPARAPRRLLDADAGAGPRVRRRRGAGRRGGRSALEPQRHPLGRDLGDAQVQHFAGRPDLRGQLRGQRHAREHEHAVRLAARQDARDDADPGPQGELGQLLAQQERLDRDDRLHSRLSRARPRARRRRAGTPDRSRAAATACRPARCRRARRARRRRSARRSTRPAGLRAGTSGGCPLGVFAIEPLARRLCRLPVHVVKLPHRRPIPRWMDRGLYIAASGMLAEQVRQDQIANDLANASTPGYKADRTSQRDFGELLLANSATGATVGAQGTAVQVDTVETDFSPQPGARHRRAAGLRDRRRGLLRRADRRRHALHAQRPVQPSTPQGRARDRPGRPGARPRRPGADRRPRRPRRSAPLGSSTLTNPARTATPRHRHARRATPTGQVRARRARGLRRRRRRARWST